MTFGAETKLTDREWIKAFLNTLDAEQDHSHETYEFLRDNRFSDDGFDQELEIYQQLCHERGIQF
jgi:hypothetical protein